MGVPPTPGARTGAIVVPRALLIALTGVLLAALLAVAFLLGRETGRAERDAPDLVAAAAPVEPAPPTPSAPRTRRELPPRPTRPRPSDPEPAPRSSRAISPVPPPAPEPETAAEPAVDAGERAAVARYFEEFDEIAAGSAGPGDPQTMAMAMALLGQATGGDWGQFDELGDTQRTMLRRLRGLRVPTACREYHQKMVTMLEAGADLLDAVRQGVQSGNLGALSTLTTTAQRLQSDADEAQRLAVAVRSRYDL